MAFGIPPDLSSTWECRALLGIGAALGRARLWARRCIARSRERHALADLDDRLLRDIGVIRDRDIGVSDEAATRGADKLFWPP